MTRHFFFIAALVLLIGLAGISGMVSGATMSKAFNYSDSGGTSATTAINNFSTIMSATGDTIVAYTGGTWGVGIIANTSSPNLSYGRVYIDTFNTSRILSNSTVTSAAYCVYAGSGKPTYALGLFNLSVVQAFVGNPQSLVASDYSKYQTTPLGPNFTYTNWTVNVYNCVNFSSGSLSTVSKTGYTNVSVLLENYLTKSTTNYTWSSGAESRYTLYPSANANVSRKPYLEVTWDTYSPPAVNPPNSSFTASVTSGVEPLSVTFTDTTTNTPTTWNYSFRNVTPGNNTEIIFVTSQNPTQSFGKGNYSIRLNTTNSAGWNQSVQTTFINVTNATPPAPPNPPDAITGLTAYIVHPTNATLRWTNPTSANFLRSNMYVDGVFYRNFTNTTTEFYYNYLTENKTYLIGMTTESLTGDRNLTTWANISFVAAEPSTTTTPPDASFTRNKYLVRVPGSVTFTDTSTGTPTSWLWYFSDGQPNSTEQNPVHKYIRRGYFPACLIATNAAGSDTACTIVGVIGF